MYVHSIEIHDVFPPEFSQEKSPYNVSIRQRHQTSAILPNWSESITIGKMYVHTRIHQCMHANTCMHACTHIHTHAQTWYFNFTYKLLTNDSFCNLSISSSFDRMVDFNLRISSCNSLTVFYNMEAT